MPPLSTPTKPPKTPFLPFSKRSRHAIPRSIPTAPTRSLVDCGVVGMWERAEPLKSSRSLRNATSFYPHQTPQKLHFPPFLNVAALQSHSQFRPRQRGRSLIVMWVRCATGRNGCIPSPGGEMLLYPNPTKQPQNSIFPLLKTKPPCDPTVDSDRANAVAC